MAVYSRSTGSVGDQSDGCIQPIRDAKYKTGSSLCYLYCFSQPSLSLGNLTLTVWRCVIKASKNIHERVFDDFDARVRTNIYRKGQCHENFVLSETVGF